MKNLISSTIRSSVVFQKFSEKNLTRYTNPLPHDVTVAEGLGTLAAKQEVDERTPKVVTEHFLTFRRFRVLRQSWQGILSELTLFSNIPTPFRPGV